MFRRAMTLIVAAVLLVGLAVGGMFLPVPYLVASPGLALNTLGERDGERVIQIDGRESYEHDGGLSMVTVQYVGGPGSRLDLFTALSAWLSPTQAVLPEEAIFPPDRSVEEITESQTLQMDDSQQAAVAAALGEMNIDYQRRAMVAGVSEGLPADGELEAGDVIVAVDGAAVTGRDEAVRAIRDREPGDPVQLTIQHDGDDRDVTLDTTDLEGQPAVGALIGDDLTFPFDVHISVGDIGGPSAGMMFALGVMDHLSEEGLTGGHQIAGTGTITADGVVGGVSGVEQKMVSAERQGAEYFFVARESCAQTLNSAATGEIDVVAIEELDDAVAALEAIRTGEGLDELPRCS
ncbi:PDZ domain-containing protein [Marinactinospora rubrisoli]|uniref:PDZ domain-containing protein n=1 Tax=Marinactinospora rubrisoli TaxID=2715399 RepID=A0ABW2KEE9_9ACTN